MASATNRMNRRGAETPTRGFSTEDTEDTECTKSSFFSFLFSVLSVRSVSSVFASLFLFFPLCVLCVLCASAVHSVSPPKRRRIRVRVPGSSANLGSGFDHLGLALAQYTTVTVTVGEKARPTVSGLDADLLADAPNLVERAMERLAAAAHRRLPPHTLTSRTAFPSRGVWVARRRQLLVGYLRRTRCSVSHSTACPTIWMTPFSLIATQIEGHADNVAASLYGGIVAADGGIAFSLSDGADLRAVLFVPDITLLTSAARAALPLSIAHKDAVMNVGQCGDARCGA